MTRRFALLTGSACAVAFVALALVVRAVPGALEPLDVAWNEVVARWRPDAVVEVARFLSTVGGGWIATWLAPILLAVAALLIRGWRTALVVPIMLLTSTLAVQAAKALVGRERPADMLVTSDIGSFPSGHTANAATIAIALVLILPRVVALVVGIAWTVAMALSRTVLSVHWLSDTVGGALLAATIGLVVIAAFGSWAVPPPARRQGVEDAP